MFDRVARLEKAGRLNPDLPIFARLADEHLRRGRAYRALQLCREGCDRFPQYVSGFLVLSRCHEARGDLEEARRAMGKALRLDPENPSGFRRLAGLYAGLGNADRALRSLEQAGRLDPLDVELPQRLAEARTAAQTQAGGDQDVVPEEDDGARLAAIETPHPGGGGLSEEPAEPSAASSMTAVAEPPPADEELSVAAASSDPAPATFEPPSAATEDAPASAAADETDAAVDLQHPGGPWEALEPHLPAGVPVTPTVSAPAAEVESLGAGLFEDEPVSTPPAFEAQQPPARATDGPERETVTPAASGLDTPAEPVPAEEPAPCGDVTAAATDQQGLEALAAALDPDGETEAPGVEQLAPSPEADAEAATVSGLAPRDDGELLRLFQEIESQEEPAEETPPPYLATAREAQDRVTDSHGIATATLAEIYANQGLTRRAAAIYRRVLEQGPDNQAARRRLEELLRASQPGRS